MMTYQHTMPKVGRTGEHSWPQETPHASYRTVELVGIWRLSRYKGLPLYTHTQKTRHKLSPKFPEASYLESKDESQFLTSENRPCSFKSQLVCHPCTQMNTKDIYGHVKLHGVDGEELMRPQSYRRTARNRVKLGSGGVALPKEEHTNWLFGAQKNPLWKHYTNKTIWNQLGIFGNIYIYMNT